MKCLICTAPTDAFACKTCAATTQQHLTDMAELLDPHALDQRRAGVRGISYAHIGGRPSGERPLPYNPRVGEAESLAYGTLFEIWKQLVHDEPSLHEQTPHHPSAATLAAWLAAQVMDHLRFIPDCDDYFSDIADKHHAVIRLWDNRPEQTFIGSCGASIDVEGGHPVTCTEAVYAERGKASVKCRRCEAEHDVAVKYAQLVARCADHLATLKEIAQLLAPIHGERVKLRRLKYLTECGRLAGKGEHLELMSDGSVRRVSIYRIGDVERTIAEDVQHERERREKRAAKKARAA